VELSFDGDMFHWRGPAPFHFVWVPQEEADAIADVAGAVSYGWGMVPVTGRIGETSFTTALWPKEGRYVVPVKDAVRRAERLGLGDVVTVHLEIAV
jgi:hypothetical protein